MANPLSAVQPFAPTLLSGTVNIAVTTGSQVIAAFDPGGTATQIRMVNVGTQTVFILLAWAGAPVPVATVTNAIPLLAGSVEVWSITPNAQLAVIASATGSTLYVTAGVGN